jgi:hypothetical protein
LFLGMYEISYGFYWGISWVGVEGTNQPGSALLRSSK